MKKKKIELRNLSTLPLLNILRYEAQSTGKISPKQQIFEENSYITTINN